MKKMVGFQKTGIILFKKFIKESEVSNNKRVIVLFFILALFCNSLFAQQEYVIFSSDSTLYTFVVNDCGDIISSKVLHIENIKCSDSAHDVVMKTVSKDIIQIIIKCIEDDICSKVLFDDKQFYMLDLVTNKWCVSYRLSGEVKND